MADLEVDFELNPLPEMEADFEISVLNNEHDLLVHRDYENQHPISAITGLETALNGKVEKTEDASKVYGTDENGQQTTYDADSFGQVDDVKVGGVSVVTEKIAELGTMAGETASDYSTKAVADTLYATISYETTIDNHIADKDNPHEVTKAQVGLGNVDNTSDADKPVSTATQTALDGKQASITTTNKLLSDLVDDTNQNHLFVSSSEKTTWNGKQNALSTTQLDAVNSGINQALVTQIGTNQTDIGTINGKIPSEATSTNQLADKSYVDTADGGLQSQITINANDIDSIEVKIPNAASSTNQLADKDFVNSSISTNTANFIGTFANVTALNNYSGTITNNDYAFVINSVVTDNGNDWATFADLDLYDKSLLTNFDYAWVINGAYFDLYRFDIINQEWDLRATAIAKNSVTLNTAYNRYKAIVTNSTVWEWEYTLNNSSFTASQWASINSGATTANIGQIATNTGDISSLQSGKADKATTLAGYGITDAYTKSTADSTFVPQTRTVNGKALSSNISLTANDVGALADDTVIPTVNDSTITLQQNGATVDSFTLNQASNKTINIETPDDYYTRDEIDSIVPQDVKTPVVYFQPTTSYCYDENDNRFYGSRVSEKLYLVQSKTSGTTQVIDMSTTFSLDFSFKYLGVPSSTFTLAEIMVSSASGKGVLLQVVSGGMYYRNNITSSIVTGTRSLVVGNTYDVRVEYNGTKMVISWKLSTDANYTEINATTCTVSGTYYNYASIGSDGDSIYLPLSSVVLVNDGTTLYDYVAGKIALDYDETLTLDSNQLSVVVDQTYDGTSVNPQSGIAINAKLGDYALSSSLAAVATSGDYDDLVNKPTIPAAQVNSDWNASSGVAQILNKPTLGTMASESASDYTPTSGLATVATTGAYSDLSGTPTIPTVNNATLTIQKNGTTVNTFTANASSNVTANISVPTKTSELSNDDGFITGITSSDVTTALGYTPVNPTSLATVATSGSYNDLSNKPTVDQTYDGTSANAQSGVAVASAISGKANTDLSNLTSQGQNIANWSSNVTNCITEIPQDINLELNNGTLTLKAGSKVYVPNGVGKFDVITIESDKIRSDFSSWGSNVDLLSYLPSYGNLVATPLSRAVSGSSDSGTSDHWWYDTTNNKIKSLQSGSYAYDDVALPIAIITIVNGTGVTSIDQVFNGFGYIGSTVFALPGVKGLIPNGRNADGSLKNIEFTTSNVLTATFSGDGNRVLAVLSNGIGGNEYLKYDKTRNVVYNSNTGVILQNCLWGSLYISSNKITSLTPKTAFHALDYNDSSTISGWSMPSSRYVDLTLGASGSTYTAPANGWFAIWSNAGNNSYIVINKFGGAVGSTMSYECYVPSGFQMPVNAPVLKNEVINIRYSVGASMFRFYYAEGENV